MTTDAQVSLDYLCSRRYVLSLERDLDKIACEIQLLFERFGSPFYSGLEKKRFAEDLNDLCWMRDYKEALRVYETAKRDRLALAVGREQLDVYLTLLSKNPSL